jgi:hypothetical protein
MNAHPEEEFASNIPVERRELDGTLPSQELLDELMKGPRKWATYFNDAIQERFSPDEPSDTHETQTTQKISSQLNTYEQLWIKKYLPSINNQYQTIVTTSPETLPQQSELSFHIINQYIMPQWQRVLVSSKYPKMDIKDLEAAQIRLAIESSSLFQAQHSFEQSNLLNNELLDIDAAIQLLQMTIDGESHNQPGIITVPHPEMGSEHNAADFLVFEPMSDNTFKKTELTSADILSPRQTPGLVAIDLLDNLRLNLISRRPEFQDKAEFHKFVLAHKNAKLYKRQAQ